MTFRPNMEGEGYAPRYLVPAHARAQLGHDSEVRLILADDQLAAVFVRLDGQTNNPEDKGLWHLEAGFGKCNVRDATLFRRLMKLEPGSKNPHEQGRVIPIRRFM